MQQNILDSIKMKGIITFKNFQLECDEALEIDRMLQAAVDMPREAYEAAVARLQQLCRSRELVRENLVVTSGREVFARLLADDVTYTGAINWGALGTGSTAVAAGNTALATEVARKEVASRLRSSTTVTIDFYYSKSDTNGTYNEFGMFIDGTSALDSGVLFNRLLAGGVGWAKSATEAMTVSCQVNINAS